MLSAPAKRRKGHITLISSISKSNCFVNELAAYRNSGKINPTIRTTKDRAIARIIKPIVWGNFRNPNGSIGWICQYHCRASW